MLVRNAYHPENFIDALPALSDEYGFGIKYFTSPSSLSSLSSAPSPHTITHQREVTNSQGNFQYASLDNIEPSLSSSACSNTPLPIPAGWTFAPNSAITRQSILLILILIYFYFSIVIRVFLLDSFFFITIIF